MRFLIPLQQFAGAVGTTLASLIVALSQTNYKIDFAQATAQGAEMGLEFSLF